MLCIFSKHAFIILKFPLFGNPFFYLFAVESLIVFKFLSPIHKFVTRFLLKDYLKVLTIMSKFKNFIKKFISIGSNFISKREYLMQKITLFNERPVEYNFVFKHLANIYPRTILDVGTGTTALPHLMRNCGFIVTAIDNRKDYWPNGMENRHYYVIDDDIVNTKLNETFDLVTCISTLEHIEQYDVAIKNIFGLLKPNGFIILTFPYNENQYVRNVYELPGSTYGQNSSYITQVFSRANLNNWMYENKAIIKDQEYWKFYDGDYWTVGTQLIPPIKVNAQKQHQISCILIQRSY